MIRPFDYFAPRSANEVTELLLAHPAVALLAGGTDLLVDLRAGATRPAAVIDLKRVDGLDECRFERGGDAFVGACVTLDRIVAEPAAPEFLREAAASIGTHQVRNKATLVGNLCHASPAADAAPPLLALGASVRVRRADGSQARLPLDGFFAGVKKTALAPGEWVVGVELPSSPAPVRGRFRKRQRVRGHDLAVVNVAACAGSGVGTLRVAVGACAPTPLVFGLDDLLPARGAWLDAAWARVAAALRPISDNRGSAEYRMDMARLFVTTMLAELGPAAG